MSLFIFSKLRPPDIFSRLQSLYLRNVQRKLSMFPPKKQSQCTLSLTKEIRTLSTMFHKYGYHKEALLTRHLVDHVRSFSTSNTKYANQNPDRENPERDDNDDENEHEDDDDDEEKKKQKLFEHLSSLLIRLAIVFTGVWALMSVLNRGDNDPRKELSWQEFYYDLLLKGEVERVEVIHNRSIVVYLYPGANVPKRLANQETNMFNTRPYYYLKLPEGHDFKFEEKIREVEKKLGISPDNGLSIRYYNMQTSTVLLFQIAMLVGLLLVLRRFSAKSKVGNNKSETPSIFDGITKARFTRVDGKKTKGKTTFKDVAGLQEAKVEVMEFVDYLKNPDRYKQLGAKIPKGALLLGPPGCGKTLLAKAVATEAGVPFLAMAGSEFVEMLGGLGASRVRSLFQEARKSSPCIIYLDEIDAIGRHRGGNAQGSGEEEHTLNQLLVEMDGMGTVEGIIMLASTNRADVLDKALLRPGRFDRHILIDLPTLAERKEMFEMYLQKLKLSQPSTSISLKLAQLSPSMTGADIANICNEAALHAARDNKSMIDPSDFDYAVERVIAGVAKKSTVLGPAEKKIVAYHESGHALVSWLSEHTDAILKISIIPRTSSALGFAQHAPSDRKLFSKEMLFEQICVALGGRVAESLIFNHVTTGAQDDLKKVTKIVYSQIKSFGMNDKIGCVAFPDQDSEFGSKPYSKKLAAVIDNEAQKLIAEAYKHTEQLLLENKEKLHVIAKELLEKEVVTYDDVHRLIGAPPYGEKNKVDLF